MAFGPMGDVLPQLGERNVRVSQISEPSVPFGIVQGDS